MLYPSLSLTLVPALLYFSSENPLKLAIFYTKTFLYDPLIMQKHITAIGAFNSAHNIEAFQSKICCLFLEFFAKLEKMGTLLDWE